MKRKEEQQWFKMKQSHQKSWKQKDKSSKQKQDLQKPKERSQQRKGQMKTSISTWWGGIVHKYFPECYGFDEHELNRILAAAIKSEQCQRIIEIVKRESAGNAGNETHISQNYGTNQSD